MRIRRRAGRQTRRRTMGESRKGRKARNRIGQCRQAFYSFNRRQWHTRSNAELSPFLRGGLVVAVSAELAGEGVPRNDSAPNTQSAPFPLEYEHPAVQRIKVNRMWQGGVAGTQLVRRCGGGKRRDCSAGAGSFPSAQPKPPDVTLRRERRGQQQQQRCRWSAHSCFCRRCRWWRDGQGRGRGGEPSSAAASSRRRLSSCDCSGRRRSRRRRRPAFPDCVCEL